MKKYILNIFFFIEHIDSATKAIKFVLSDSIPFSSIKLKLFQTVQKKISC